jgi:iron(III) transport system permease protein
MQMLLNSAILAGGATAIALPLGTLLALTIGRLRLPGWRAAAVLLGMLLFLPLYVQLSGWDAALGKLGWLTLVLGANPPAPAVDGVLLRAVKYAFGGGPRPWLDGMFGAIFVHGVAAVPWVSLIVGLGLAQVDSRQEEAALLEASPLAVLCRITLPQCAGFIVAAALWVVVSTATEMTVTNVYVIDQNQRTFTEQFYMNYSLAADASEATLGALPGLAGLAIVIIAAFWLLTKLTSRRVLAVARPVEFPLGLWTVPLALAQWLAVAMLVAVPVASLLIKAGFVVVELDGVRQRSWSAAKAWEVVSNTPWQFRAEFSSTLAIALPAATLSLALAVALAWPARRGGWWAMPAIIICTLCLAIPGPLVGVATSHLFNVPWSSTLQSLYDDSLVPTILTVAIHALPVAVLIAWHSFASLRDDELLAAALDGAGPLATLWCVALPQRWPALAGAWLAALAVAAGDLAWSLLVLPPGVDPVPRRIFGLVHAGVEEQVAGICLVMIGAYGLLAALFLWMSIPRRYN